MNNSEWHQAARDGTATTIDRLIANGKAVDLKDRYGQTALMLAATHGHTAIVEALLDRGTDTDVTAKFGLSALMLAIVNNHIDIAATLIAAGADTALEGTGAPGFAGKHAGELAREAGFNELADTIALDLIARAFAHRSLPTEMSDSKQLSDVEYDEVMVFEGMRWQDVTFEQIEENADAVFWFAPEAFCYYLPGFLSAGIREERWDTNAYDSCIGMLDRSPQPENWDEFFEPRWTLLSRPELRAVEAWVDWFEALRPDGFHANSYDRSRDTLRLLAERCG